MTNMLPSPVPPSQSPRLKHSESAPAGMLDMSQETLAESAVFAAMAATATGCVLPDQISQIQKDLGDARAAYYRDYRIADFTVDLKRAPAGAVDRHALPAALDRDEAEHPGTEAPLASLRRRPPLRALGLLALLALALLLFLALEFLEALLLEQRILASLFFLGLAAQLLAVVGLRLGFLDDGLGFRLGLGLHDRGRRWCLGHFLHEGCLDGQRRKRRRPRIVERQDHRSKDDDVQQQREADRDNVVTVAYHAARYSGIG